MTSPEAHQSEQPVFAVFDRAELAELEDAHALAAETGHPAGHSVRAALDELDNENRIARGAEPLDATAEQLQLRLLREFAWRNEGALSNGGKPRIPIGYVAIMLGDEGIMTRGQAGRAIDLYETNRRKALAEGSVHVQDWAERAAHDRIDG